VIAAPAHIRSAFGLGKWGLAHACGSFVHRWSQSDELTGLTSSQSAATRVRDAG
jgi:hypothetical protein